MNTHDAKEVIATRIFHGRVREGYLCRSTGGGYEPPFNWCEGNYVRVTVEVLATSPDEEPVY